MKIRLVVVLVGLAIRFAVPTFAQQKDAVDPKVAQQIRAFAMKYDEVFNKNDPATVAALYTEDAVFSGPHGTFHGRQAIENHFRIVIFGSFHAHDRTTNVDHIIAVGNEVRLRGRWSDTVIPIHTFNGIYQMVLVREGDSWKIRGFTFTSS
jgi:uncharacterized protein (TIGR02246 family)